ncbi:hypothetical protein BC332_10998 [Capsicum chinense]|nr:hypothetical protein BC332_10998 [Capsicum chinense]
MACYSSSKLYVVVSLVFVLSLIGCVLGEFPACSLKDERMVEDHGHGKLGKLNECQNQTTRRFQVAGPLNAKNVLGAENRRPVPKWEAIIRRMLDWMKEPETKLKSYSALSSFKDFSASGIIADAVDAPAMDIIEEASLDVPLV